MSPKQQITRRLALAAAGALSARAALAPGAANAGTYQMYNCHVAGHETGHHGPWTQSTAYGIPGVGFASACGGAGGPAGYAFGPYASGALGANSRVNLTLAKDNSNIAISGMKLSVPSYVHSGPSQVSMRGRTTSAGPRVNSTRDR